ncbi:helix-turn-helix domain-containing protein [Bacillus sp. AFS059628]|uniref:helix-turn-helix domain-containing protein n=1 Tax=Bacillus sp. AFS059628 TaxID=2033508 RepID=UPI0027B8CDB8|nr:helix-turn-helix domain-containing protein [Bacillus sp. AFS059628]
MLLFCILYTKRSSNIRNFLLYRGRLKKYTDKHPGMNHAIELRKHTNKTVKEICQITSVSQTTLYRRLKELE